MQYIAFMTAVRSASSLPRVLGARVRQLRSGKGWSRRVLAQRAGLSERFLAEIESGRGNPSVVSLGQIAHALESSPGHLLERPARSSVLALLGLRGAGKSTVGRALAERLDVPFIELDARIEEMAGLALSEIFELHGEEYYRRSEREALESVLAQETAAVIATGGGIVTHPETFGLLKESATTIWLQATPEEHWSRVVSQGDHRPMANDPLAQTHLRELLQRRTELYRTADHAIDTSRMAIEEIVERIAAVVAA